MKLFGRDSKKEKRVLFVCVENSGRSQIIRSSTLNVNMGCMDKNECPAIFLGKYIDWNIEDPKDKPIEKVREIRKNIEEKIKELCKTLE